LYLQLTVGQVYCIRNLCGCNHISAGTLEAMSADHDFRPEIQGLRAVSVVLVVLFHLWPTYVRGGYVGVDVFFVISGFLITSHLVREITATGRVQVTRFWARRIRRLLPASLLVLALSAAGVRLWVPETSWDDSVRQLTASTLYVQNWALSHDSIDYLALDSSPTVAQHYWSLSVEEQFYAAWPLLLLLALALLARRRPDARRRAVGVVLAGIAAASFAWSVWATSHAPQKAYFSTFTRAWEFAAGALVALVAVRVPGRVAGVLGWTGLGAIVAAGLSYSATTPFPGWVALLPVLGACAVLLAAAGGPRTAGWWLSRRPGRFVGDISYSVYLVHWPLVVLLPLALDQPMGFRLRVAVLALTFPLAWLSKVYVEDPLRRSPVLGGRPWRAFACASTAMAALVVAVGAVVSVPLTTTTAQAAELLREGGPCVGPAALADPQRCGGVAGRSLLVTPLAVVKENTLRQYAACQQSLDRHQLRSCEVGDPQGTRHYALVGDSHAGHWVPMVDELGRQRHARVTVWTKSSCPSSDARRVVAAEVGSTRQTGCEAFNDSVDRALLADGSITDVLVSSYTSAYTWASVPGHPLADPARDGFRLRWERWLAAGKRVHVIRDVPAATLTKQRVPDCIALRRVPEECALARRDATRLDVAATTAQAMRVPEVTVIDLTSSFCDARLCYAQVGGVIVYRDRSHVSVEYSRLLAREVSQQLA
jgi:peptidoglycan/LPS O-acetylase OafA/YrhL